MKVYFKSCILLMRIKSKKRGDRGMIMSLSINRKIKQMNNSKEKANKDVDFRTMFFPLIWIENGTINYQPVSKFYQFC